MLLNNPMKDKMIKIVHLLDHSLANIHFNYENLIN